MKRKIYATLMFFTVLPPAFAASGRMDCDDYYYGIHHTQDLTQALKCYEAEKRWEMLIVMSLNGEGTPASVAKAEELLLAWQKADPSQADSLQAQAFRKIIDERKPHPGGAFSKIDFCGDVAGDTVSMTACAALEDEMAEAGVEAGAVQVKAGLTPAQAALLDKVVAEYEAFKKAEGRRMYQQSIDVTSRGMASFSQQSVVRSGFLSLLGDVVVRRELQPAGKEDFEVADRALNREYQKDLKDSTASWKDGAKEAGSQADRDQYRRYVQDYKVAAKSAQLHWIRYRDLWAELAGSLFKDNKSVPDPALSIKTAVTRMRVSELQSDPMGAEEEEGEGR
jgi:uncharacterized protein YecT (DUF1311 family)